MSGSAPYGLNRLPKFERSLTDLIKSHYKAGKQLEAFYNQVTGFFSAIETAPHHVKGAKAESWPANAYHIDFRLYKLYFNLPGLTGAAREGRLMYLVCDKTRTVDLLWIYTHKQFAKRPPDGDLKPILAEAVKGAIVAIVEPTLSVAGTQAVLPGIVEE